MNQILGEQIAKWKKGKLQAGVFGGWGLCRARTVYMRESDTVNLHDKLEGDSAARQLSQWMHLFYKSTMKIQPDKKTHKFGIFIKVSCMRMFW